VKVLNYLILLFIFNFLGCASNAVINNNTSTANINNKNTVQEKRLFFEEPWSFSVIPPELWQELKVPGLKYKVIRGQMKNDFAPTILFSIITFRGELSVYVDYILEELSNVLGEDFVLIQRSDFSTQKKLEGEKIIANVFQDGLHVRQNIYFFSRKDNMKIYAVCGVLAETGDTYDEMFDKTMKTFEWTEKK
jgi:hypothetical protein